MSAHEGLIHEKRVNHTKPFLHCLVGLWTQPELCRENGVPVLHLEVRVPTLRTPSDFCLTRTTALRIKPLLLGTLR